jgi:prepilin-type N-terminal cleavage/methylation domain-containing protein
MYKKTSHKKNLVFRFGFTLAEVLITLLIIGVISSIVIPGLIQDTRQAELKTAWKKAFATISQAVKMQKLNENQVNVGTLKNYMKVMKNCSVTLTLPECVMDCPTGWGCNAKPTASDIFITDDGMKWGDFGSANDKWCVVDVNGLKGPNKMNQDTFVFCIMPDGHISPSTTPDCDDGATHTYTPNAKAWLYQ